MLGHVFTSLIDRLKKLNPTIIYYWVHYIFGLYYELNYYLQVLKISVLKIMNSKKQ